MRAAELLGSLDTDAVVAAVSPVSPHQMRVVPVPGWLAARWPATIAAMTLPWCVYVRSDVLAGDPASLSRLVCHELVHARQWRTDGRLRFARRYLGDYLRGRWRGLGHADAYRAISYEVEARLISAGLTPARSPTDPPRSPGSPGPSPP